MSKRLPTFAELKKFLQSFLSGGVSAIVEFGLLLALAEMLNINYLIANTLAFVISCLINFAIDKYWVFKESVADTRSQLTMFMLLCGMGLLFNMLLMWLLVAHGGIDYRAAKVLSMAVLVVVNYMIKRKVVFA